MAKGETIYIKVQTTELAKFFKCSNRTLKRWIREKRLDPTSLDDIVDKYLNRHKLDKRRRDLPLFTLNMG